MLRITFAKLLKFPFAETMILGVVQACSKRGPRQVRVAGRMKRGRCAGQYLACTARKNAKVTHGSPLIVRKIAKRETLPSKKRTAGDGNVGCHGRDATQGNVMKKQ